MARSAKKTRETNQRMKIGYLRGPTTATTYVYQDGYSMLFYLDCMHSRQLRMLLVHRKAILTLYNSIFAFFVTPLHIYVISLCSLWVKGYF